MHGVINKAYIEKFKPLIKQCKVYIITNVKVTAAAQKYRLVENDKVLNFLPTTNIKKIKDTIVSSFFSTDMLSNVIFLCFSSHSITI